MWWWLFKVVARALAVLLWKLKGVNRLLLVQVLRKISAQNAEALVPHYSAIIPSLVSLLQQTQGPTKLAGDRTLGRILQVIRRARLALANCRHRTMPVPPLSKVSKEVYDVGCVCTATD